MAFDPQDLKARACEAAGLNSFGEAPFKTSLNILCRSLDAEARLGEEGTAKAEELLVGHLTERLRLEDFIARHPEVVDQQVAPAIFLVGMPRSGTTALAQHLSEDPALRSIPRWESKRLTPPEHGAFTDRDPRIAEIRTEFAEAFRDMPWRQKILPNNYDDPAEHGLLMALTFLNLQWPTLFHIPRWTEWALAQDLTPGYEYMARVLKVLQWARPAERWNLKLPPDLFAIDTIAGVFPDAVFVWSHRDPVESISSVCSLCTQVREKQGGASVDPVEVGPEQLEFQARAVDLGLAARERIGEGRFVDVLQSDLGRDTVATISALYDRLGLGMSSEYRSKLERRIREKPRGRFGRHEHDLGSYGLTEDQVRNRFSVYIERFHTQ
ncbi:MAG: sulfotransferase [Novosphingobium sp.]|nr:sulfotransferase [Novosphingobium sp.]